MSTSTTSSAQTTGDAPTSRNPLLAALGIGTSVLATAVGTFFDLTNNESGEATQDDGGPYLFVVGIILVTAAIVFGLVVRTAAAGNAGRRAVILGVVGVLSVAVFWAGLPLVLAAGAVACALTDRDQRGSMGGAAKAGTVLAAITAVGAAWLAIAG